MKRGNGIAATAGKDMADDDMYAGLKVPRAKRPAPEKEKEKQAGESVAAASEEQRPAKRQRALTVPETVAKLRGYMVRVQCPSTSDAGFMGSLAGLYNSWWTRSSPRRARS